MWFVTVSVCGFVSWRSILPEVGGVVCKAFHYTHTHTHNAESPAAGRGPRRPSAPCSLPAHIIALKTTVLTSEKTVWVKALFGCCRVYFLISLPPPAPSLYAKLISVIRLTLWEGDTWEWRDDNKHVKGAESRRGAGEIDIKAWRLNSTIDAWHPSEADQALHVWSSLERGKSERVTGGVSRFSRLSFLSLIPLTWSLLWSPQSDGQRTRNFAPVHCLVCFLPPHVCVCVCVCVCVTDGQRATRILILNRKKEDGIAESKDSCPSVKDAHVYMKYLYSFVFVKHLNYYYYYTYSTCSKLCTHHYSSRYTATGHISIFILWYNVIIFSRGRAIHPKSKPVWHIDVLSKRNVVVVFCYKRVGDSKGVVRVTWQRSPREVCEKRDVCGRSRVCTWARLTSFGCGASGATLWLHALGPLVVAVTHLFLPVSYIAACLLISRYPDLRLSFVAWAISSNCSFRWHWSQRLKMIWHIGRHLVQKSAKISSSAALFVSLSWERRRDESRGPRGSWASNDLGVCFRLRRRAWGGGRWLSRGQRLWCFWRAQVVAEREEEEEEEEERVSDASIKMEHRHWTLLRPINLFIRDSVYDRVKSPSFFIIVCFPCARLCGTTDITR